MEYKEAEMFSIIGMIFLCTIIVLVAVVVYYIIYANRINKKIQSGDISIKKMIDIPKVIMISIIVLLLMYSIILSIDIEQCQRAHNSQLNNRNNYVEIDLTDYKFCSYSGTLETNDASFAKIYSKEENEGYKKTIHKDGDFVFTVFTRISSHDDFHPDYLCYVDYVGAIDEAYSQYENCEYLDTASGKSHGGMGAGGSTPKRSTLFIGNLNDDESMKITIGLLDEIAEQEYFNAENKAYQEDKGEFPKFSEYANVSGSIVITVE